MQQRAAPQPSEWDLAEPMRFSLTFDASTASITCTQVYGNVLLEDLDFTRYVDVQ